jgi:ArsR family metal-binding transcriptional regulator
MTLYPEKVYITQVQDSQEGLELLSALVETVNATWDHSLELVAVTAARRAPGWLYIWTLLPQTNCKQCGEATCSPFATALLQQTRALAEYLPMAADPAFTDRRATLEAML